MTESAVCAKEPEEQAVHVVDPPVELKNPGEHGEQTATPSLLILPASQSLQFDEPVDAANFPEEQLSQLVADSDVATFPDSQSVPEYLGSQKVFWGREARKFAHMNPGRLRPALYP